MTMRQRSRPVEEQQVYTVPLIADAQALLAADESKVAAQFKQEVFEMADQGFLKITFRIFILKSQELKNIGIPDFFIRTHAILGK
jgi:hypothetical protein